MDVQPIRVGEVMQRRVITVSPDDDLHSVRFIFQRYLFHHLLVTENHRLVGVVSDRDLLRSLSPFLGRLSERPQDRITLNRRVHQIMTRDLVTATADALLEEAAELMLERKVSCLPIVTVDARPVGIVTWRDFLSHALGRASVA